MNRLRVLQAFFTSLLLVSVVVLQVSLFADTNWLPSRRMIDDLAVLLFFLIVTFALVGSLCLNVRLLARLRPTFEPSATLLPQIAFLIVSGSLLYLIARQEIMLSASYDVHLSRYYLELTLPRLLPSTDSFFSDASISIAGDGTQVVVVFLFLMTSNLAVGIYNTGWLSPPATVARYPTSTLVFSHITVGLLVAFWAVAGFVRLNSDVQAFAEALKSDPDVMNASNLAHLVYVLLCYSCLGAYAQWILRDGWNLGRELKCAGKLRL